MDINATFRELAEYKRLQEQTSAIIDTLQDEIKEYMKCNNLDTITGNEHAATYKQVTSNRIDTSALKKGAPDIAAAYTKQVTGFRFVFK